MSAPVRVVTPDAGAAVVEVAMDDAGSRNGFTAAFREALPASLAEAAGRTAARVVLVTGAPDMFCSGGSREELLTFTRGADRVDADDFFRAFARCPLPVVAAMRGHALGGGLVLGLYADVAVLSDRSVYTANFLQYGFTPGMGATDLVPRRLGDALGVEMLFTARRYRGSELRERGAGVRVAAHDETEAVARALAADIAAAPRASLELLKAQRAEALLRATDEAIAEEVRMHEVTFTIPEVRERILADHGVHRAARPEGRR